MNGPGEYKGVLEDLDQAVRNLMAESKDIYFTEYLQKMQQRIGQQKFQAKLLQEELNKSYQMYVNRMKLAGIAVEKPQLPPLKEQTVLTQYPCHTDIQIPQNTENIKTVAAEQTVQEENTAPEKIMYEASEENTAPEKTVQEAAEENTAPEKIVYEASEENAVPEKNAHEDQKEAAESEETVCAAQTEHVGTGEPVWTVRTESSEPAPSPDRQKKSAEFTVGAAVLSVVGGTFILAALVTLGMTFMGGIFKGVCLYAASFAFLLLSELWIYRRWPMLGSTVSAIGIGGLYLSTLINDLALHNFNLWMTVGVTFGITVLVILLSRRRDSILYRIIGMTAAYLCFMTIRPENTETEFLVVTGMILLMNIICILLPVKKYYTAVNIVHMSIHAVFTLSFTIRAVLTVSVSLTSLLIFVFSSVIVQQFLYIAQCFRKEKEKKSILQTGKNAEDNTGILITYYITSVVYAGLMVVLVERLVHYQGSGYAYGSAIAVGVIGVAAMLALYLGKCQGKRHIYSFLNLAVFCLAGMGAGNRDSVICILAMLIIVKILMHLKKTANMTVLRVNDAVITTLLCFMVTAVRKPMEYVLLAGVIGCVLAITYWHTWYEILLMGTLVLYTAGHLPAVLELPAVAGLLLASMLLFNNIAKCRGKNILIFNLFAMGVQSVCYLNLLNPVYQDTYICYFCMLIFGAATIMLMLQERYHMDFKGKYVVLALFFSYMAFVLRVATPVINSIIMMVIALVSVGVGFASDKKNVRIYGLILSLFVCGKLVLYDFFEAPTIQKTILFFSVGMIALIIAATYIILEKKNRSFK